jgi:SNF2 family DNA or RNA helicase
LLIHQPTSSLLLRVRDPFAIREVLPKYSRLVDIEGHNISVKFTEETARVLRNMGLTVPAPIGSFYSWPGKYPPFDHQRVMADFLTMNYKGWNLSEMGTGKTYATLWAADYLMQMRMVRKVLILTTLSTMDTTWKQDIFDILMHRNCVIVHGSVEKRMKMLSMDVDFYIANHDIVKIEPLVKELRKRTDIDLVVLDEAAEFRNHDTDRYRYLEWMLEKKPRFWPMTGTPFQSSPADAWALARLIDKTRVTKWPGAFKRATMRQVTPFKWAPKPEGEELAYKALQPAVRFKKSECLDLPPCVTLDRQTKMSKEQKDQFLLMRTEMIMRLSAGEEINAVNGADKINKLRQILCGAVKDGEEYRMLNHAPRLNDLLQVISTAAAKVVVIVPFKGILQCLEKEIGKHYSVSVLNGDVSANRRGQIISDFKYQTDPHVLACHPRVMAHGLNLTEADTTVFYAPIYSAGEYAQVIERMNRAPQTRKMTIVRMAAHPLEWAIYKMVDERRLTQDSILALFKTVTENEP